MRWWVVVVIYEIRYFYEAPCALGETNRIHVEWLRGIGPSF